MFGIEDVSPQPVDFKMKGYGIEVDLTFRPFVVADESWLNREFGAEGIQKVFSEMDMEQIARIGFKQLTLESKEKLFDLKFMDRDEDGKQIELATKGTEKLLMLMGSLLEQADFIKCLIETRGLSMPLLNEIAKESSEEVKKKIIAEFEEKHNGNTSFTE